MFSTTRMGDRTLASHYRPRWLADGQPDNLVRCPICGEWVDGAHRPGDACVADYRGDREWRRYRRIQRLRRAGRVAEVAR
jgi:hypothetical protein